MEKLELSYINLEEDHKEIFLDVACLIKGWSKENAVIALESCGFFAEAGLRVLEQKSLITISNSTYGPRLEMHYHIEEMGKNIVRRLNPNEPERHSRLWIKEEIVDVLANNSGTQETKCITMFVKEPNFELLTEGLSNMKELRFLEVDSTFLGEVEVSNWNFDEDSLHLPNALRFLKWRGYPFSSLPKTFQANNLVGFEMGSGYLVQLWKDGEEKAFLKLRFLKFHYTLMRTLNLSVAPNLETLILECCFDLVELDFQVTSNLKELRIDYCDKLKKLHMPAESPNLETLRVENCSDMVELHMPAECPKLVNIDLTNLKLRTLQLGVTPNLETLRVKKCTDMVELHMPGQCPQLVDLDLSNLKLTTLYLGITPNLKTVSLKDCSDLVELQISAECPKLVNLDLSNCIQFAELPEDIGRLECLKELDITGAGISRLPESIFRVKGLRIVGSRRLLESCGFTSAIKISDNKTFCYI